MAYYPQDIIDQLRLNSDIVSLINEDTVLKGRGDRYMGLCPFPEHNEKTPSFSVSSANKSIIALVAKTQATFLPI